MNMLLINLAVADLMMAGCGAPMVAVSSFHGRWVLGDIGCQGYAFFMGQCGLASIVTMAVIALERVCGVASYHLKSPLQKCGAPAIITFIWGYSSIWVLPPLFGWGEYTLENYGTACSFKFEDPTKEDLSFLMYLFVGGFVVPCTIILVSYMLLWSWVVHNQRAFQRQATRMKTSVQRMRSGSCSNIELRVTKVCGLVLTVFLIAWLPYAVITLVAAFGGKTQRALITPIVCILPGIFAKMSSIYNPMLYAVSHPAFKKCLQRLVCHRSLSDSPRQPYATQAFCKCGTDGIQSSMHRSRKSGVSPGSTTTSCKPVLILEEKTCGGPRYSGSDPEAEHEVFMLKVQDRGKVAVLLEADSDTRHIPEEDEDSQLIPDELQQKDNYL